MLSSVIVQSVILLAAGAIQYTGSFFPGYIGWGFLTLSPSILAAGLGVLIKDPKIQNINRFFIFSVILLGPFATAGCFFFTFFSRKSTLLDEFQEYLAEEVEFTPAEKMEYGLTENYWAGKGENQIDPFVDIMKGKNSLLKRSTIDKVIQHPGPYSKKILELGLNDKDPDVRFYAASGLILLNETFMKTFSEYKKEMGKEPENEKHYLLLSQNYRQYCDWNLPSEEDRPSYIEFMKESYLKVLELSPRKVEAIIGLGRVYLDTKDYKESLAFLEEGMELTIDVSPLIPLYMEALFYNKKFSKMKAVAQKYLNLDSTMERFPKNEPVRDSLLYWSDLNLDTKKNQKGR